MNPPHIKRFACVLLLLSITGCINQGRNNSSGQHITLVPAAAQLSATGPACRAGPNGGPPPGAVPPSHHLQAAADRGIGGTGGPTIADSITAPADHLTADDVTADRGIGGTGIVGVITGFASICVDGLEVTYDASAPVDINGTMIDASWLRVGQVVAIHATVASPAKPVASTISIRVEVTGRVERVERANNQVRIGGQPALVNAGIPGSDRFTLGDWVAVSGLRRTDGVIVASRLDAAPAGRLTARGQVTRQGDGLHLGALALPAGSAKAGDWVQVSGFYVRGQPKVQSVAADTICPDPAHCFAGAVEHVILQAFVHGEPGHLRIDGMQLPVAVPKGQTPTDGFAIISLDCQPDGSFTVADLKYVDPAYIDGVTQLDPAADPLMIETPAPYFRARTSLATLGVAPPATAIVTVTTPSLSTGNRWQNPMSPGSPAMMSGSPVIAAGGPTTSAPETSLSTTPGGSPLPDLSIEPGGGVPISSTNPTGSISGGTSASKSFTGAAILAAANGTATGGAATSGAGHAGAVIGSVPRSIGAHAGTPSIMTASPILTATSTGAGSTLTTGGTITTTVVSVTSASSAAKH